MSLFPGDSWQPQVAVGKENVPAGRQGTAPTGGLTDEVGEYK